MADAASCLDRSSARHWQRHNRQLLGPIISLSRLQVVIGSHSKIIEARNPSEWVPSRRSKEKRVIFHQTVNCSYDTHTIVRYGVVSCDFYTKTIRLVFALDMRRITTVIDTDDQ